MNAHGIRITVLTAVILLCIGVTRTPGEEDPVADSPSLADQQRVLFERINLDEAWRITKGDPAIVVGVVDNGFDFFHPDLKGQMTPGFYYSGGYHVESYEVNAHGTMMAGIIAAKDDGNGMVGLAPKCRVLTASQGTLEHKLLKLQKQYFVDHPKASLADFQIEMQKHQNELASFGRDWVHYQMTGAAEAVRYLVDHGARVINISGGLKRSLCPSAAIWQQLEEAFAHAAEHNVVIVLSAGNSAARWEDYPGNEKTVIVAGASLLDDTRWETEVHVKETTLKQGSNFGKRLTVMAPVENLVTCQPHEERSYRCDDGPLGPWQTEFKGMYRVVPNGATSSAAPIVSSLVALLFSIDPTLDAKTSVDLVKQGCDDIGEKGIDEHTGHGRINFGKTLQLAVARKRFSAREHTGR